MATRARRAADLLRSTHRLPQAARALQIAAQCDLDLIDYLPGHSEKTSALQQAMDDLTQAIALLSEHGDIELVVSQRLVAQMHDSVASVVPRWRF
jgi:hypothetical protein